AKAPRVRPTGKKNLAAAPEAPDLLPPTSIVYAPQPKAGPAVADLGRLPRPRIELPPARDLASLPPGTPSLPGSGLPQAPPPAPADLTSAAEPADSNNVWEEKPSSKEQPEIRVYNRSRLAGDLIIRASRQQSWSWRRPGLVIQSQVEPIAYSYEVRGPIYRFT